MRWFKHISASHTDETMSELTDNFGAEGYGVWWIILEKVAANATNKISPAAKYHLKDFRSSCKISKKKLLKILEFLQKNQLLKFSIDANEYITIAVQNLDICMEYSRLPAYLWIPLRNLIFERDNYTCQYCGEYGKKLECDHVIPVAKGGSHTEDNLVTACFKCNRAKRDKLLEEWLH